MKSREATKEYFEAREQAIKEMKEQYNLTQKQVEIVFNSYVSIDRIKEICNFQLSKEKFSEFFNETKKGRVMIYCEVEEPEEVEKTTGREWPEKESIMRTLKEMRKAIKDKVESIPEKQISTGNYVQKIGYKYVHILNTWETTTIDKVEIADFYDRYCV